MFSGALNRLVIKYPSLFCLFFIISLGLIDWFKILGWSRFKSLQCQNVIPIFLEAFNTEVLIIWCANFKFMFMEY